MVTTATNNNNHSNNNEEFEIDQDDGMQDLGLPVSVQTFLWRQIAPFIRPKLGKLHEASCMFCQHAPGHHESKEACKSFEKVLVQNIQFGLSPPLTKALGAIPRWRLLQAALPHVMHCVAALLHNRVKDMQAIGQVETKLLYTMQWIILYAAEECADDDGRDELMVDGEPNNKSLDQYLFSVPTITLFVYLFAPIIHHLKESDFQNFRLENGIKLWQGMWDNRAPGAPCFTAPVKPKARNLLCAPTPKGSTDVFSARKQSLSIDAMSPKADSPQSGISEHTTTRQDEESSWVSSPKEFAFPETIPEEASSVEDERVVIFRLPSASHLMDNSFFTADASLLTQQHPQSRRGSHQSVHSRDKDKPSTKFEFEQQELMRGASMKEKRSASMERETDSNRSESVKADVSAATFLDVAVMRCLFISHWQEEGIFWSLQYMYNRLSEIGEESSITINQPRKRSNSLPIPQIEISLYQGPNSNNRDSPSSSINKDYIEIPEPSITACLVEEASPTAERRGSEKKKRVKMSDLRAFVETKMFSKSEKNLEKVGLDTISANGKRPLQHADIHRSLDTGEKKLSRSASMITREPASNLIKGKSMPSLSCLLDSGFYRYVEPPKVIRSSQSSGQRTTFYPRNPIITVTEHTPTPSPDYLKRQGSIDSQLDALSNGGSIGGLGGNGVNGSMGGAPGSYSIGSRIRGQMLRSHTDSHIDYTGVDESEAPGSSFYITRDGGIDYEIVLLAVLNVFKRDLTVVSIRVLEAGLNICELLLEMGVLKLGEHAHEISMGIVKRALQVLGCPHGCNDGVRGLSADFLRNQCQKILSRLLRNAGQRTKRFLQQMVKTAALQELIEFFHAFCAFCVDPSSLLSPLTHKRTSAFKNLNTDIGNGVSSSGGQGGYSTNFSGGLSGGPEAQVIAAVFKPLVTRFVNASKDLKTIENLALYGDVRQLVTYVKGAHGGPFRLVALSGILAVTPRPHKKGPPAQTTRVIRHIPQAEVAQSIQNDDNRSQRRLLLKKRSTSSACAVSLLETEPCDEHYKTSQSPLSNFRRRTTGVRPTLTPRHSERQLLSDSTSSSERNSLGRLSGLVRWFKGAPKEGSSIDLEIGSLNPETSTTFVRHPSLKIQRGRSSDGIGRSIQRAKRRVERRLNRFGGIVKGKKKQGGIEETADYSRRSSSDMCDGPRESEVVVLKERKLIPLEPVRLGMLRLSFLLETCAPGSFPDPQLVAAVLDLPQAPLVTRATFLLECAHFVHLCNKGQWPVWMKQNIANYRQSGANISANQIKQQTNTTSTRRTHILQRTAGKMFHQWAEMLGARLEEIIFTEHLQYEAVNASLTDPEKQRELLQQDEEEDFLDEASVNPHGNDCPHALKLIACVLLFEITAFLRDIYVTLPKASKLHKDKPAPWEKVYREANRRWSMALSSMGHSQTSAQSLQSIAAGNDVACGQTERKISFVLHEPDNESENSSNTTLTKEGEEARRPPASAVRPFLSRRGTAATTGGSFKRRSLKLRRNTKDGKDMETDFKRVDSIQSRRKVSSLSDRSDTSEQGVASGGEEEHGSPGILSDDQQPESPTDSNETDDTAKSMPWLKAVIDLIGSYNYYCSHKGYCHPYCYKRHMRACTRLVKATRKVYGEEFGFTFDSDHPNLEPTVISSSKAHQQRTRSARKVSEQSSTQTSPSKRKDSLSRKDRISDDPDLEMAEKLAKAFRQKKEQKEQEETPMLKFLRFHVRNLFHFPFATMLKGAVILTEEMVIEAMPAAWELLLEPNQDTASSSAAVFLMGSVKAQNYAFDIMQRALKNKDPDIRIGAIQRYLILWKNRFHVWPRMEDNAHDVTFKVPPGGIEFTLPSPKIGIESLPVVDPPWMPVQQTKDMDVTLNQDRHTFLVTATKSRKMQQTEAIRNALRQQRDKQRAERHSFLITTIPISQQASHEPGMEHEDHEGEEEIDGTRISSHLHHAHSLFPSVLCSSVMQIVGCLDDAAIGSDGNAVYEVAYQVIWVCLVEESALFLRYVFERLTRDRQDQMFKLLRHLIRFVPRLPQQAAFALYNSIIGYIMFYVRSSNELKQELVGSALSVLWMVVHSVHGIMFKDLKQILRKEQCDASILLTANVPAAKKIIVHGPSEEEGNIPSQFPVQEDTLFCQLLKEALDYYSVDEKDINNYCLVDHKSNKILNPNWYIRDLYFFKRSQYPEVRLLLFKPEASFLALQKQELTKKFVEIGKVHLTWAILKNVDMVVQRVVFLHEELMKLPSFPRKALEVDLDLHQGGEYGKVLLGLDVLHKFMWVRLIARMFEAMAGNFAYSADIQLFLNVLSGAAFLHAEDSCIMRYVMATYINAAFNFKNIFSTNGYFMIMPTLLQIYSLHQTNKLITTTIEYAVKQFYLLNRKPFILQMFGSVSAILDTDEEGTYGEAHKVQSSCLFNLLLSLEDPSPDPLNIAELVKEPKPLKAIDFCYHDEDGDVTVLDCITLCVMVVSYSAESTRGYQMLIILEAILPCYLQQIQSPSYVPLQGKSERDIILQLAVAIRTMVHNCEGLAKSYNGPYRNSPEHKGSSQRNCSRGPPCSPGLDFEEESHSKYITDPRTKNIMDSGEDSEMIRTEYRRPRDVLLSVVGDFLSKSTTRLQELSKKLPKEENKLNEVLDAKCHIRLADIAHSLLKVSPYDPESMACRGLQRYMQAVLPRADWSNDTLRNALVTILRRIDKVFLKISKKPSIRRNTDWEAAAGLLKGIHETIVRHPYVLHWQQMKTLISTVQNLIVNEPGSSAPEGVSSAGAALMSQNPPAFFCSTVVRLVALQVVSPVDCFSLVQICGGSAEFSTQEKAEGYLMHLIMPLCLKVCSGRGVSDVGELKMTDVSYLLTAVLNAMSPPAGRTGQAVSQINRVGGDLRTGSLTFTGSRDAKRPARIAGSLYQAAFLALRIVCICFENRLSTEWSRIVRVMRDLGRRNEAAPDLWSFLEFVVTHRTPLYIVLMPFILHKISQPPIGDHERHMQFIIRERLRGTPPQGGIKSKGALLLELARELKDLRDELEEKRYDRENSDLKKSDTPAAAGGTDHNKSQQRPSLISIFTGTNTGQATHSHISTVPIDSRSGSGGICTPSDTLSQQTLHPPRESLSSSSTGREHHTTSESQSGEQAAGSAPTLIGASGSGGVASSQATSSATIATALPAGVTSQLSHSQSLQQAPFKAQPPKLRFVSSVEFRHSSGETSTTPLSPESPAEDSSGDHTRSRLQRSKAASRKTFRLKRSRLTPMEPPSIVTALSQDEHPKAIGEISWDSVSQTSSTSGYRDTNSLQTGLLSPDGSLGGLTLGRSPSQHSLLMVYEGQDEDTLI